MLILNYQKMSTEDGLGLRTTLFVKGCPLKCRWCHNPESISFKKQVEWLQVRCMGCIECVRTCPNQALTPTAEGIIIAREKCAACGKCIDNYSTGALEAKGQEVTVEQAYKELEKDKAYFGPDGGVTLSGGEIMAQAKEAVEIFRMLKEQGIGTAEHEEFTGVRNEQILENFLYLAKKVKGTFSGFKAGMGRVKIDRVYNSIPPVMRYIYPFDDFTKPVF